MCLLPIVSCAPGQYQATTEAVRVFDGESYKERYPVCRACPVGMFADQVGSSRCSSCPEYHQTRATGSTSAQNCYGESDLL